MAGCPIIGLGSGRVSAAGRRPPDWTEGYWAEQSRPTTDLAEAGPASDYECRYCAGGAVLASWEMEADPRSEKAGHMARSIEQERAQLEADEQRLNERRKQLADRERSELLKEVERSGLMKADPAQFSAIIGAIKKLGIAETVKRLTA
ncbi:hypothetical protein LTR94_025323 [Friedmanniomyces endolithicus]|nr:hypothetical protein LTR94_025323 [Friedmanniomyces endolithicus]